jgi:hypothetical protein
MNNRVTKFHELKNHLIIGKSYVRLNDEERTFCLTVLDETKEMDDNKYVFTINRLGVSYHPEFLKFKHGIDIWSLLLQSIDQNNIIRGRK